MKGDCPTACGSYKILSDDNSYLSHHCDEFVDGKFGNCNLGSRERKVRIYDHLMYRGMENICYCILQEWNVMMAMLNLLVYGNSLYDS